MKKNLPASGLTAAASSLLSTIILPSGLRSENNIHVFPARFSPPDIYLAFSNRRGSPVDCPPSLPELWVEFGDLGFSSGVLCGGWRRLHGGHWGDRRGSRRRSC